MAGTFFPFTSYRSPVYPPPRYRSGRSSQNNFVPLQSSVLGVRVLVPRALYDLFNGRPPYSPPVNYPRPPPPPPPYQPPFNSRPYNPNPFNPPIDFPPQNHPGAILPPNGYSPPGRGFSPPISPAAFFNLMRAFYPNLIYRPDSRYPNVFAIRFPTQPSPPNPPDFYRDPSLAPPQPPAPPLNPDFNEELPPNDSEFFEPPLPSREFTPPPPQPLLPQQAPQQAQNQQFLPFGRSSLPFNSNNNNNNNNFAQRQSNPNQLIFVRS